MHMKRAFLMLLAVGMVAGAGWGCRSLEPADKTTTSTDINDSGVLAQIRADIRADAELARQPIEVRFSQGTAYLEGTVKDAALALRAVAAAKAVPGVNKVVNLLRTTD